jgi:hypothetical protein
MSRVRRRLQVDHPPGRHDRRVFVGGNYDYLATLRKICDFVSNTGFTPILAWDFEVPHSRTHDYDLRLLHQCRFAIFEETIPAGELMELERTRDYGVITFVVYQVREEAQPPPSQITSMATTYGVPLIGYATFGQLEAFIHAVFPSIGNQKIGEAYLVIAKAQWLPPQTKRVVIKALDLVRKRGE